MYWAFLIGICIGAMLGMFVTALCVMAREREYDIGPSLMRDDDDAA